MNHMNPASYPRSNHQDRQAPRKVPRRHADEDRAWSSLYRSIGDPAAAAEVIEHLDADAEARRQYVALYLCSKQTMRRDRERRSRNERIGHAVRAAFAALVALFSSARRTVRHGGDLALEVVAPERVEPISVASHQEPAVARVRKLSKKKEFAPGSMATSPVSAAAGSMAGANAAGPQGQG